ncbi:MAG: rhodanese-like domain-containing protein [Pseudomonadota bacterium]|nr:rhodanese-like domain-containing protein [Pseudomonadota bacterium]
MTRLLIISFIFFITNSMVVKSEGIKIDAPIAFKEAQSGTRTLIDVRHVNEWRMTGIPSGGIEISIHDKGGLTVFISRVRKAVGEDKGTPISLICASGNRSSKAAKILIGSGFTDIRDVAEGMMGNHNDGPGWLAHGLPVRPCTRC